MEPYPKEWPRPNPDRPESLQSRISEQQKLDLYNRITTTRDLARLLNVHEKYVSYMFPYKVPLYDKRPLAEARKAYKLEIAVQVLKGQYKVTQAAKVAHVCTNTMQRLVTKAKELHPDLAKAYKERRHAK